MKYFLPFLVLMLLPAAQLMAQVPADIDLQPCGTTEGRSPWLKHYQAHVADYQQLLAQKSGGTYFLPMTLHIVGRDDSTGMAALTSVLSSFCQLNTDFAGTGIQFYIEEPIRYIYETAFYSHDSVPKGGVRMLQHNVANTINVYFVGSPAGNCGYAVPYAGVAMNNGCLGGHTFAHELGHNLGLPHTFLGWEGGTSWGGNAVQSFNGPAPQQVTINYTDFKDSLYLDTLIIDTVFVEYVTRSGTNANCSFAADGFCDTPADYLAYRWQCNSGAFSTVTQYDPDTVAFISDGQYIMSYSFDNCQAIFSQEQIAAMQAFIITNRQNMLYNPNPTRDTVLAADVNLKSPAHNDFALADANLLFEWSAAAGATHYLLEIYKEPYATNQVMAKVLLTDTFYQSALSFPPRPAMFPYGWRVLPFNHGYTCAGYTSANEFNSILASGTTSLSNPSVYWNLYPNAIWPGSTIQMDIATDLATVTQWRILTLTGQELWSEQQRLEAGTNTMAINIPADWVAGIYFVEMRCQNGYRAVKKMIIR